MNPADFKAAVLEGIPDGLPPFQKRDPELNHAPARKDILTAGEKKIRPAYSFNEEPGGGGDEYPAECCK